MKKRTAASLLAALALMICTLFSPVSAAAAPGLRPWQYGFGSAGDADEGVQAMIDACGLEHLSFTSSEQRTIPYWIYVPKNEDGTVPENLPVVLYMHGYSDGGNGTTVLRIHNGVFYRLMEQRDQPDRQAIVLIPQTPQSTSSGSDLAYYYDRWVQMGATSGSMNSSAWNVPSVSYDTMPRALNLSAVIELLQSVQQQYRADVDRAYVTGMSMGGCATWDLISRDRQHLFAAAVPICGIGDPTRIANAGDVPIRLFHGTLDSTIPPVSSRTLYSKLRRYGNITYTEYPDESHFSWNSAYSTTMDDDGNGVSNIDDLIAWMFNQSRHGTLDGTIETAGLRQLVSLGENASSADYSAAAWKQLRAAVTQGRALLEKESITREEVQDACAALDNALNRARSNLCLNKPVTATATGGSDVASKAVDGSISTWWDSGELGASPVITVDLEQVCSIEKVHVVTFHGGSRAYRYQVYGSLDQRSWSLICEKNDGALSTAAGTDHVLDTPSTLRYLQLRPVSNTANNYFHLCEIEAYGDPLDFSLLDLCIDKASTLPASNMVASLYQSLSDTLQQVLSQKSSAHSQQQIDTAVSQLHERLLMQRRVPAPSE